MLDTKRFEEIIETFSSHLHNVRNENTDIKLADDKWSLKEIIGHLIDSAANNHQRFVRLHSGDLLDFPAYDGEEWIGIQKYNSMDWDILVALWYNYNRLLLNIIGNSDDGVYGNVWVMGEDAIPFEQLANDYYKHLELHIEHFSDREQELISAMKPGSI